MILITSLWSDAGAPNCNRAINPDLSTEILSAITNILAKLNYKFRYTTDFHDMYVWLGLQIQFISNTGY